MIWGKRIFVLNFEVMNSSTELIKAIGIVIVTLLYHVRCQYHELNVYISHSCSILPPHVLAIAWFLLSTALFSSGWVLEFFNVLVFNKQYP